jgi:heterotetrameric sarcosine oxidase gamma subunit
VVELPQQVRVVVVGGGIVGCSVAYHLALRGCSDVLLLERHRLTSGTTWHAAGLVGQLRATRNLTRLAQYTTDLFATLEADTGQATGFLQRGSIAVARTPERFEELRRQASMARTFGLEVQVITPDDVAERVPLARTDDLVGAVLLPNDGQTNPVDTTLAFAKGARDRGVRVLEGVAVDEVLVEDGRAVGVRTPLGEVRADAVVTCAGMWSRALADRAGAVVPLHAAEHFYVVTEPIDGLDPSMPVLRDLDGCSYFKEDAGKLLVGWFEPVAKPWAVDGIPDGFAFGTLPPDLDHVEPLLQAAAERMPVLADAGIRLFFNGPESFTPDDRYLLGESPDIRGLFVATGFNSIGIQSSGGAGKVLADWVLDGRPPMDLWDVDVRRMMPFQRNARYLRERTVETLGLLYAMHWPHRQPETARGVRRSPVHDRLAAAGACFGETAGWERANWFAPEGVDPVHAYSYGRQGWFEHAAAEHLAVRTGVGLFDLSSFAKLQVEGPGAERILNRVGAADVAVDVGRVVYTQWLNDAGGIEADLTVTRTGRTSFLVVTAAATQVHDLDHLRRAIREHDAEDQVCVVDVTSAYAVFSVMGPRSRDLLGSVSPDDLSDEGFPFGTSRTVDVGHATVRATRISYVGELGWELYVPTEFAAHVFDTLREAGAGHDLRPAGYHALDSLRMEKAYRHWGHDIGSDDTPLEAGLGFAVAWQKPGGFVGRAALERQRAQGVTRRLVQLAVEERDVVLLHNEPILRDGRIVGETTSAAHGHTVGRELALGWVANPDGHADEAYLRGGDYRIDVGGTLVPAALALTPLYDPRSARIRSRPGPGTPAGPG